MRAPARLFFLPSFGDPAMLRTLSSFCVYIVLLPVGTA